MFDKSNSQTKVKQLSSATITGPHIGASQAAQTQLTETAAQIQQNENAAQLRQNQNDEDEISISA